MQLPYNSLEAQFQSPLLVSIPKAEYSTSIQVLSTGEMHLDEEFVEGKRFQLSAEALKRKSGSDDDAVSEELNKKCRITVTPGELRLAHDWDHCKELVDQGMVTFLRNPRTPLRFQFYFPDLRKAGLSLPNIFNIQIPRFYPHQPPIIFCDCSFYQQCAFVGSDGRVIDPLLNQNWSSILTLQDVITTMRRILCTSYHGSRIGENMLQQSDLDMDI